MLIPILPISKTVAAITALFVALEGHRRWKENRFISFEYFWKGMFWMGVCCAAFALPAIVSNLYLVQAILMIADFSALLTFAYLIGLLSIFVGYEKFHTPIKKLLTGLAIFILIVEGFFFRKALVYTYPIPFTRFIGMAWTLNLPFVLRIWFGVFNIISLLIFAPLLFEKISKLDDPREKNKGFFITLALIGSSLAASVPWLLIPLFGCTFLMELLQGLLCIIGPVLLRLGMELKTEH